MNSIVLTGGGTAGHVMPNISLLPGLKKKFDKIYYIGSSTGIEKDIVKKNNLPYYEITTVKLQRKFTLKNLAIPFKMLRGIKEAKKILKELNPSVVFSKGGFVAVPVVIAARKLKIPIVAHESDFSLGLANRIIYRSCKSMCVSFESTLRGLKKGVYTGSPIRESIFNGNKSITTKTLNLDETKKTILVIGGSLGAVAINNAFRKIINYFNDFNIIHIVGKGNLDSEYKQKHYKQIEFATDIENIFAAADYIVTRAGSNAIFEFAALIKPMLLIPLPKGASRGDQIENAKYFEQLGIANVILQENITEDTLKEGIKNLIKDENKLKQNIKKQNIKNGLDKVLSEIGKHTKK